MPKGSRIKPRPSAPPKPGRRPERAPRPDAGAGRHRSQPRGGERGATRPFAAAPLGHSRVKPAAPRQHRAGSNGPAPGCQPATGASRRLLGFHAVREALRATTPLRFVAVTDSRQDRRVAELVQMARAAGVAVRFETAVALDRWANGAAHHGVVAEAEVKPVMELETLLASAPNRLLLALDGWEDPQNLGAAVRAACGAGVDGILLPSRRSVGLTETVERVSAGALEHVAVARVGNLVQALERCREAGWWIVGLDAAASAPVWTLDLSLPTVIVVGAEGSGLHELTRKRCDVLTSIPLAPGVESLNAAMAAAIVLFETARQRAQARAPVRPRPDSPPA